MARTATLKFDKKSFSVEFVKVDRKKLYGWSKIVVSDKDDNPCSTASIADGSHILPSKSTTLQGFNENGESISRSNLVGVDSNNKLLEKVLSTYDIDSKLEISSLDDYLSLNVKSVYQLNVVENKESLSKILNDGTILTFPFNYRADYEADDAFIISSNQHIFAVVGAKATFEFIGLENKEEEIVEIDEEQINEDEFDFGML
jgi:hypothetical protein